MAQKPQLDTALLLKIISSESYWHKTFRPKMIGVSRWKIDSLRDFRNRIAHNDGADPLFRDGSVALPYLQHIQAILIAVGSTEERKKAILSLIRQVHPGAGARTLRLLSGKSRWSIPLGGICLATGLTMWLCVDHLLSPRLSIDTLTIGTADPNPEKYTRLKRELSQRLRVANIIDYWCGKKIDVRLENASSYPEAMAKIRERKWDIALGFSPVVSMYMGDKGYRFVGVMFPEDPIYSAIFFSRKGSHIRNLSRINQNTRIALGDVFSASKYYVPLSMLRGRAATLLTSNSTADIVSLVRSGKVDIGVIAGQASKFEAQHPGLKAIGKSISLPQSIVGISPAIGNADSAILRKTLLSMPAEIRERDQANFGPGRPPDYRKLRRDTEYARALSACIRPGSRHTLLSCGDRDISIVEGWIDDADPLEDRVILYGTTISRKSFRLDASKDVIQDVSLRQITTSLKGRYIRVLALVDLKAGIQVANIDSPNQIEFLD